MSERRIEATVELVPCHRVPVVEQRTAGPAPCDPGRDHLPVGLDRGGLGVRRARRAGSEAREHGATRSEARIEDALRVVPGQREQGPIAIGKPDRYDLPVGLDHHAVGHVPAAGRGSERGHGDTLRTERPVEAAVGLVPGHRAPRLHRPRRAPRRPLRSSRRTAARRSPQRTCPPGSLCRRRRTRGLGRLPRRARPTRARRCRRTTPWRPPTPGASADTILSGRGLASCSLRHAANGRERG